MSGFELLKSLGDIDDQYVAGAAEFRRGRGRPSMKRVWLIAAIVALMLLLVGCVAYSQGWFASFFAGRSGTPLSDSQLSYIEENEQKINETQSRNGWTVELRSTMRDGNKAYIILGVTGPEGLDLTPEAVDGAYTERYSLSYGNGLGIDILSYPRDVFTLAMTTSWEEDGDGLENTANVMLEIEPNLSDSTLDPFGGEAAWTIRFDRIVHEYEDTAYKQELLNTKYKDAYGVMFTQEEIQRIHLEEVMAEGNWEFAVTFAEQTAVPAAGELLTAPIQIEADILRGYGDEIWEYGYFREEITVISVQTQPLSLRIGYEECNGSPSLSFADENLFVEEDAYPSVVMQDGTMVALWESSSGSDGYVLLDAPAPIIWEEAEYLQFADGTKLYMDGSVEYPERMAQPAAAEAYRNIESETGVYAYYGDFDEDSIEDMAVWYDGCFHALCLLDEAGETKREFTFENGVYVYETYNQRAEEIKWEPNLIRILETEGDAETVYFYRATVDGLELSVATKKTAEAYFLMDSGGAFEPVTREEYQAVAEDFQMVYRRMRPIQ